MRVTKLKGAHLCHFPNIGSLSKSVAYATGETKPNYPVPVTETVNALAMPYERVMPIVKAHVLWFRKYILEAN